MSTKIKSDFVILALVVVTLMVGCMDRKANMQGLSNDEVRNLNHQVLMVANKSIGSAIQRIDLLKTGAMTDYNCGFLRAKIYSQSLDNLWLDSAIIIGEQYEPSNANLT